MKVSVGRKDSPLTKDRAEESTNYRLSSSMSNEFRVLINEILGLNAMLIKECDKPELKGYASNIQNTGRSLLSLVNDVMDFSKIESGEMEFAPVTYDSFLMLNEDYDLFAARAQDKNLDFVFKVDSNLPMELYGDEKRIRQIISNLLFYSIKYTKRGNVSLEVTFERVADGPRDSIELIIVVKDTGDGIPEVAMEHLFDISERIEQQRDVESVDLALNLTKRLVDLQCGSLEVDSTFGRGTTFKISIPQMVKKESPIGDFFTRRKNYVSSIEVVKNKFRAPNVNILVADELPMNLRVVKGFLKDTGITVDEVSNGMEALEKIKRKHYHIIFLDKEMPVMNGEEAFDIMKSLTGNPNMETPVVLLMSDDSVQPEFYKKAGFADCMQKPVREEALFAILNRLIPSNLVESKAELGSGAKLSVTPEDGVSVQKNEPKEIDAKTLIALIQDSKIPSDLLKLSASGFIDVNVGLNFCKNDEELYRNLLVDFQKLNRGNSLEAAMDNEDFELYRIEMRSLKSAALTIGAIDVASRAKAMEFACKDGHYDYVQMHHQDFIREYNHLINALTEIL